MYRRLVCVPVGSLKLQHLATASRFLSEVHRTITRQGIHEITDLQDVLLCTRRRIQADKQSGEMDIFTMATQLSESAHDTYTIMYNI